MLLVGSSSPTIFVFTIWGISVWKGCTCMRNGCNYSTAFISENQLQGLVLSPYRELCFNRRKRKYIQLLSPEPTAPDIFSSRHEVYWCWQSKKLICLAVFPLSLHFNYVVRANIWQIQLAGSYDPLEAPVLITYHRDKNVHFSCMVRAISVHNYIVKYQISKRKYL